MIFSGRNNYRTSLPMAITYSVNISMCHFLFFASWLIEFWKISLEKIQFGINLGPKIFFWGGNCIILIITLYFCTDSTFTWTSSRKLSSFSICTSFLIVLQLFLFERKLLDLFDVQYISRGKNVLSPVWVNLNIWLIDYFRILKGLNQNSLNSREICLCLQKALDGFFAKPLVLFTGWNGTIVT